MEKDDQRGIDMSWFNLRNICLFLFASTAIADVAVTILIRLKHPIFNESNPMYILGVPLWGLLAVIIIIKGYLLWFLIKRYYKLHWVFIRYWIVYFIVLAIFITAGAVIVNISVLNTPSELIIQGTPEQNLQNYIDQIGDLKVIENLTPPIETDQGPVKLPFMFILVVMNVLQFLTWRSFEVYSWNQKR